MVHVSKMEEIDEERPRKRVCLDQAFWCDRDENARELSQGTDRNLGHPTVANLTPHTYPETHNVSRTASLDAQPTADISQSAGSSIAVEVLDELTPSLQSKQYTRSLEAPLDDQVCFGMVSSLCLF